MRKYQIALVAIALMVTASVAISQEKAADKQAKQPTPEEMMAIMQKYGTPGAEHAALKPLIGTFDADCTMQMAPDAPPMTSRGKTTNKFILGDRWLKGSFDGDFMGQPFQGIQLLGYDKLKKKYVSSWIDSMMTARMDSEGEADSAGKVITLSGTCDCPFENRPKTMKTVITIVDNDHHTMEGFDVTDGKETKTMTIKYTRSKEQAAKE
jgi:hypothetical protein